MRYSYFLLWLAGPLQAWGADSKFGRRDTLPFPTKSGILGLFCCALGRAGEQKEFLAQLADLPQTVISYVPQKSNSNNSQKPQREILLRDFHMVGSGYNKKDSWENLLVPKTSDGKNPNTEGTKMTYRYYLQNAFFAVVLPIPIALVEDLASALKHPVWDLYLGRKCCVPSDLIYRGYFESEEKALSAAGVIASEQSLVEDFRVLDGKHDDADDDFALGDVPIQFGCQKLYRDRFVSIKYS